MRPRALPGSGARDVGPASDIYSLGVTAYYLLSGGRYPASDYPRLDELNPEVPAQVHDAVERCLARRPEDRWPSAHEFADALIARHSGTEIIEQETGTT